MRIIPFVLDFGLVTLQIFYINQKCFQQTNLTLLGLCRFGDFFFTISKTTITDAKFLTVMI